jgi:hypothetical protein
LAIEAVNIKKDCPEEDFHVQRLARDATICLAGMLYFKCTLQQGQPPHHPSVYNIKAMLHMEVKVPATEVPMKAKLD